MTHEKWEDLVQLMDGILWNGIIVYYLDVIKITITQVKGTDNGQWAWRLLSGNAESWELCNQ